jgi:hypothetical protein
MIPLASTFDVSAGVGLDGVAEVVSAGVAGIVAAATGED